MLYLLSQGAQVTCQGRSSNARGAETLFNVFDCDRTAAEREVERRAGRRDDATRGITELDVPGTSTFGVIPPAWIVGAALLVVHEEGGHAVLRRIADSKVHRRVVDDTVGRHRYGQGARDRCVR